LVQNSYKLFLLRNQEIWLNNRKNIKYNKLAMKFWLSKNGEISLREQLARQIVLAIVSGDLRVGDKLPSVREMALRYDVHPNTVSAAYVWLEERGWVESRKGSGVFVREKSAQELREAASSSQGELDAMISRFLHTAQTRGFTLAQIAASFQARLERQSVSEVLLVENDPDLAQILAFEIHAAVDLPVFITALKDFRGTGGLVAAMEETAQFLPADVPRVALRFNSAQAEMRGKPRPALGELVGVASRWGMFLRWTNTMLVAAGINAEQIVSRDARAEGWQRGLHNCAFVIADSLTAKELPKTTDVRVFRLISADSLRELQNYL
jgi:GntR family transcriptional regulator